MCRRREEAATDFMGADLGRGLPGCKMAEWLNCTKRDEWANQSAPRSKERSVTDTDRFQMLGTYKTPRFRVGDIVRCLLRGWVPIVGVSVAPIPWPLGGKFGERCSPVVYLGLADAVLCESPSAVAHWWGVSAGTVRKWRRRLALNG